MLVKKEGPMNFLIDPLDRRSTCRCADVMVANGYDKNVCVDLIEISPLVGLRVGAFTVG